MATSADALAQLQQLQSTSQDPNTILSNQQQQLGVNAAENTVTGLRGAINNTTQLLKQVAPSVMGRTAGSLVTNAQATKQISNEQAPISANLTDQTTQYDQANTDEQNLQQQAQTAASGIYQGQQDKLSYAQNLYNSLYQQEQDAATAAAAAQKDAEDRAYQQQQLAEQAREADLSAKSSSGSSFNLGGSTTPTAGSAQMSQRNGGGFNFTSANGGATNAVGYSQAKGVPIRTLLQNMANAGDSGAKTALDYVGNDYGINVPKLKNLEVSPSTYNSTVSLLRSLGFKI